MSRPSTQSSVLGRFRYVCTLCGIVVSLDISLPRLRPEWLRMISDEDRIRKSLKAAREEDPQRYADVGPEKETHYRTTALHTLNQYIKNILEESGTGPRKRISFRNKTFQVQFGRDCDEIFRYLGFEEDHDANTKESYWIPPRLPAPEGKTPIGSSRAFYEDVRSEVQSVFAGKTPAQGEPTVMPVSPAPRDELEKVLGCDKSRRCFSTLPVIESEARHFATLGAPVDADDALLKFAYSRQAELDPENTSTYLEALGTLAGRRSEELQMFVFTHQELLARQQKEAAAGGPNASPVEKAYAHFGLTKSCPEDPAFFIGVYRTYRDQSPAQKSDHRLALLQIANDRQSDEIRNEVFGKQMDLQEACQFLRVEPGWPMDSIAVMAQSISSDSDMDHLDLLLLALDAISLSRGTDDPNRPEFESVLAELRSIRRSQLTSSGTERVGAAASASDHARDAVDLELPVGLANLRNTCYLNSILQYFYSVNAVRDLALNTDFPALEPTEANLRNLLRTDSSSNTGHDQRRTDLETGRAFVGHEFARELSTLFRSLNASAENSITPRQRLANAALLRPEKLRPQSADPTAVPGASNYDAPPLPPRIAKGAVTEAKDTPMAGVEQSDAASSGSSETLVDQSSGESPLIFALEEDLKEKAAAAAVTSEAGGSNRPASEPQTISRTSEPEVKMSKLTVEELAVELDKPNVGSDQMDVDEVMGNAIDHLRAAFKVSTVGNSTAPPDPIEQAFFSTFIDNRKKIGDSEWNRTTRSDRWVTAYPAQSGTLDLYDALANSFDIEPLPGNLLSFTTIERPAPHFHVCIQRSDGVRKNSNPITIPETLYLDRFMHTAETQSSLFKRRKRKWDIKTRLSEMGTPANKRLETAKQQSQIGGRPSKAGAQDDGLTEEEIDGFLVIGGLDTPYQIPSSSMVDGVGVSNGEHETQSFFALDPDLKRLANKYGVEEPDLSLTVAANPPQKSDETTTLPPSDLDEFWERFAAEEAEEKERLITERDRLFSDAQNVAYRLHAVVCHAGSSASAGHYWVWIHDFERDVWRKYNDTTVSVHPAEFVFGELNTKGEPYYLAYVKADEIQNLVSIPRRQPQAPPPVPPRPRSSLGAVKADGEDNVMASIEHWEDVEMLPPPYSNP
ncbi:cysteine proteinase [Thermothelomyces heterothallicus CBS 203.75]